MSGVVPDQAPNKAERAVCWSAKDRYWDCLDNSGAGAVDLSICKELRKTFEAGCSNTWVKHFDRRFGYTRFKKSQPSYILTESSVKTSTN